MITQQEMKGKEPQPDNLLSYQDDYLNINEAARDYPMIHELEISGGLKEFEEKMKVLRSSSKSIPIFTKSSDGQIENIPMDGPKVDLEQSFHIVYLGEEIK